MMDEEKNLPELPKGWALTELEEISEINPKLDGEGISNDIDVTFLPMRCVEELSGQIDLSLMRRLSKVKKGYTYFTNGDLLFAKITPCMENGKVAIAHDLKNGIGFGSTEFHVIRLHRSLPRKFFFFFLIQEGFRKDAQRSMTGSAGQLRVPTNYMRQMSMPLPPLPEQHRIVAKIEELFTKLDAGVEALKKVKTQLKGYRQAVLKHAFEGKLTEAWRKAHKGEIEPASVLLERIKEERKKKAKGKYKELSPQDISDLPRLPEGWTWTRLGHVCDTTSGGTPLRSKKAYYGGSIPWLKSGELKDSLINRSEESITDLGLSNSSAKIFPKGTLLIALYGATVGKIGKLDIDAATNQAICGIFNKNGAFEKNYLFNYLISYRDNLLKNRFGGAQPNISQEIVRNILIPLPPFLEQRKISEEIERRISHAEEIGKVVEQSLKRAERLRQSILKRAFEGKLVPQNPSDEPAEKLLERIKAEKAKHEAERKKKRTMGSKKSRNKRR